ncbi:MAG TPA: hypothetical protein VN719_08365 [Gemmatimonadales bacterium]|nr:hypothetical protein [Gemmatimonadales bacterium]
MSEDDNKSVSIAEARRAISPREAREAAAEAGGFLESVTIRLGDETFEIPQRGLVDDDQRTRLDALELETESWDREPDIEYPERLIRDENGSETRYPARTEPGPLKLPYRKDGKLVTPPYQVQVAIALWGLEKYERYKKLGGRAADVTATLARLDRMVTRRQEGDDETPADPKSVGGDS